jgi:UrcA family protein
MPGALNVGPTPAAPTPATAGTERSETSLQETAMNISTSLTVAAVLTFVALSPVHAADHSDGIHDDARSLTVQFADLDLNKPEGVAMLFSRIRGAAKSVCAAHDGISVRQKQAYVACVDFAMSNTIARVDRPALTEYFASRSSPSQPMKVASGR